MVRFVWGLYPNDRLFPFFNRTNAERSLEFEAAWGKDLIFTNFLPGTPVGRQMTLLENCV